jgi:hypothetical protein
VDRGPRRFRALDERIDGSGETGLYVLHLARVREWNHLRPTATLPSTAQTSRSGRLSVLPGDNQMRLLARIRQPGTSAYDGYMMRRSAPGTDQILIERVDNDTFTTLLTVNQGSSSAMSTSRVSGLDLEAWHQAARPGRGSGSSPTRPTQRPATRASACVARPVVPTTSAPAPSAAA